jgi:acyl dehydratase
VGAGLDDPFRELQFTTENSIGVALMVLPTFPVSLRLDAPLPDFGADVGHHQLFQAGQSLHLPAPFPVAGEARLLTRVSAIYDQGKHALASLDTRIVDSGGRLLASINSSTLIAGAGGFGGMRADTPGWQRPARKPDAVVDQRTHPAQALLYRLSGDRNPLHSDPVFAERAGFDRPILHGMCTFGFAGRALLHTVANSDAGQLTGMDARFSAPVFPGDVLRTSVWVDGSSVLFETACDGRVVLGRGRAQLAPDGGSLPAG